jgi:uncharacterized repeat protein (TIGR03943 family)
VNREAQGVVLFLLGGAILRISVTDVYLRYVKAGLRPFLVVAGVLLVVIACVTLYREVFRRSPAEDGGAAHPEAYSTDGTHAHAHGGPRVAWLLLLTVFAIFLVGPPALGSYAASRGGTSVAKHSDYPPLPAGDPVTVTVLDYASRAVWDRGVSLTDRRVRVTGFVSPRPGGGSYLTRMVLTCCAADGRPVKVGLSGQAPEGLAADTWVEVVGRYDPRTDKDRANDETIPYLEVESLRVVPEPVQPYEQ